MPRNIVQPRAPNIWAAKLDLATQNRSYTYAKNQQVLGDLASLTEAPCLVVDYELYLPVGLLWLGVVDHGL